MSRDRIQSRIRHHDRPGRDGDDVAFDVGDEGSLDGAPDAAADRSEERDGLRGRIGSRARRLFSPRAFVAALVLCIGGLFAARTVVPLPGSGLVGIFLAAFLVGSIGEESRYAETAAAGGVTVAGSTLMDFAVVAFLGGLGISLSIVGAVVGAVVGVLGTYFGRDLRHGMTREVE